MNEIEIETAEIPDIVGKTIKEIEGLEKDSDTFEFRFSDRTKLMFCHSQECCECVSIEDVCGDINDLIGTPLLKAYSSSRELTIEECENYGGSDGLSCWTFYHFSTAKGTVTIRWYGESNGYYSVGVDMIYSDIDNDEMIWIINA